MLKNHFIIAWRNLLRNKLHTVINILGLAVGISACLVIFLIAFYEFGFNRQIPDRQQTYRVYSAFSGAFTSANRGVPNAVGGYLRENLATSAQVVPFHSFGADVTIHQQTGTPNVIKDQRTIIIVGPEYFSVLPVYKWLAGTPQTSLSKPFQVVLTETKAKAYFGNTPIEQIVGREISYRDSLNLTVSGIVSDASVRTDFIFTDFISFTTINESWLRKQFNLNDWVSTNSGSQCFVKTTDVKALHQQLEAASKQYKQKNPDKAFSVMYRLQPLDDLHFNAELGIFNNAGRSPAHKPTLLVLILVAGLLLSIAAINFINLETAQAIKRAREVGIRKVMGSSRQRLMLQFLLQSFIITFFAVALAIPLTETAVNVFHEFIPPGMKFQLDTITIGFLIAVTVIVGVFSGIYPAFVMSSFEPVKALKNNSYTGGNANASYLRKALIVFQFTIAQILIVGTFVIVGQIRYMLNKDLGFEKDAVVNVHIPWRADAGLIAVFRNKLQQMSQVQDLSVCMAPPSDGGYSSSVFKFNKGSEIIETNVYRKFGDTNFIPFYKLTLLAGRNIAQSDTTREFVINETYMKLLGYQDPHKVIGQEMEIDSIRYPIVGVVKDFHTQSLHEPLQPVCISTEKENMYTISMRLNAGQSDMQQALASIEETWKQIYPDYKIEYQFLDETIARFYETEQRVSKLMSTATTIAIILSCLGLFGLASYAATQRTREIGIRKVLGATVNTIVVMLSKDFVKLIVIAFILAAPIAWFMANRWLEDFAFRINISAWLFIAAAASAVVIALLTVSYHAIRAAIANPADSLRSE